MVPCRRRAVRAAAADRAASAAPVVQPSGLAAAGATAPDVPGRRAHRAQWLVDCSAAQPACCPQPVQRIQRCVQARHQGLPVALETTQAAVAPQIAHVSIFTRHARCRIAARRGVRTWTGRRRPHPTHVSWLAGSVIKQWGHSGRPCVVAGRGLTHCPAPAAGLGAGLGGAVAAQPLAVDPPVQADDSTAAGAGWADYRACLGVAQGLDQPQHRRCRCFGAGAGEQLGPLLPTPRQADAAARIAGRPPRPPRRRRHSARQGRYLVITSTVSSTGHAHSSGGHAHAARLPVTVAVATRRVLPARTARSAGRTADTAVPLLAAALQRAQVVCRIRRISAPKYALHQPCSARSAGPRPRGGPASARRSSTPGRSSRAWASRRRFARPPAMLPDDARDHRPSSPGSRATTRSTIDTDRIGDHLGCERRMAPLSFRPW